MIDYEKLGVFYMGKRADGELALLASNDLVTHAVCVGMTGSGKTGLCVSLVEEAAIDGVPVLVLDPKGDLANLALTFPGLTAAEFEPWIDPDAAKRAGATPAEFAAGEADKWRRGLAATLQEPDRIARLRAAAEVVVYTPGSDAGVPLSMLRSLEAPSAAVRANAEGLRDLVSSTTTALLALAGVEAEPLSSREHVLVATLLGQAWAAGQGFDLGGLVRAIQTPPFARVGVLDLESFYPAKDRFKLVLALNALLASPAAAALMHGEAPDIDRLLYGPDGRPKIAVISIAHLGESERGAFVTMLLGKVLSWMRAQPGTSSLRALLYMDEVAGYLPPVANPPTKPLFLTLFKQARAYGLGVVVATQNPVDVDYKVLSNAGTWFVGRLQTARDRGKVMEGLAASAEAAGGALATKAYEDAIAALGARQFLLHASRGGAPVGFETRFCMSYLRGPMSLPQIAMLKRPPASAVAAPAQAEGPSRDRPVVAPGVQQVFVPCAPGAAGVVGYLPRVLGVARVRYVDKKLGVDTTTPVVLAGSTEGSAVGVDWSRAFPLRVAPESLGTAPSSPAVWSAVEAPALDARSYAGWKKAFAEHLVRAFSLELFACKEASLASVPGESERDFRVRLSQRLRERRDVEAAAVRDKARAKLASLGERVRKAEQALEKQRGMVAEQRASAVVTVGASVLGALLGTKIASAANAQRAARAIRGVKRASAKAGDAERAEADLAAAEAALHAFEAECEREIAEIAASYDPGAVKLASAVVTPKKAHVEVAAFGLGWLPYRPDATGQFQPAWTG